MYLARTRPGVTGACSVHFEVKAEQKEKLSQRTGTIIFDEGSSDRLGLERTSRTDSETRITTIFGPFDGGHHAKKKTGKRS